jgi:hypothetical protein
MTDFDIMGLFSNQKAKCEAPFSVRPSCVRMRAMARGFDVVTRENCDRPFWKCQSFAPESEGCLLDVFSEVTKYAAAATRRTASGSQRVPLYPELAVVRIHLAKARNAWPRCATASFSCSPTSASVASYGG